MGRIKLRSIPPITSIGSNRRRNVRKEDVESLRKIVEEGGGKFFDFGKAVGSLNVSIGGRARPMSTMRRNSSADATFKPNFNKSKPLKKARMKVESFQEPIVDIFEEEKHIVVVAEVPYVDKKDISIETNENELYIKVGEHQEKVSLPHDAKNSEWSYNNGIITVKVEK